MTSAADRVSQHLSSTTVTPEKPEALPVVSVGAYHTLPALTQVWCTSQIHIMHSQHISNSGVPATPQEPVSPLSAHIGLLSAQPNSQLNDPRVCFCQTTVGNSTTNMAGYNRCKPAFTFKQCSGLLVFSHPSKQPDVLITYESVLDPYVTIRLLLTPLTSLMCCIPHIPPAHAHV